MIVDDADVVFQGLRHPAPFSDDLEPVDKPYKRVNMDEAKQGTSREWDFQKTPNCPHVSTKYRYGCLLKQGTRIEMPHVLWIRFISLAAYQWDHRDGKISRRLTAAVFFSFVSDSAASKRVYLHSSPLLLVLLCLPAHTAESCRKRFTIRKKKRFIQRLTDHSQEII